MARGTMGELMASEYTFQRDTQMASSAFNPFLDSRNSIYLYVSLGLSFRCATSIASLKRKRARINIPHGSPDTRKRERENS